jgi:hypothetical protein
MGQPAITTRDLTTFQEMYKLRGVILDSLKWWKTASIQRKEFERNAGALRAKFFSNCARD